MTAGEAWYGVTPSSQPCTSRRCSAVMAPVDGCSGVRTATARSASCTTEPLSNKVAIPRDMAPSPTLAQALSWRFSSEFPRAAVAMVSRTESRNAACSSSQRPSRKACARAEIVANWPAAAGGGARRRPSRTASMCQASRRSTQRVNMK